MHRIIIVDMVKIIDTDMFIKYLRKNNELSVSILSCSTQKELIKFINSDQKSIFLVLYYNFDHLSWLLPILKVARSEGHMVINNTDAIELFTDYCERIKVLRRDDFIVPRSYYGHAKNIPNNLGNEVVYKSLRENITIRCNKDAIHSLNNMVYVESLIANPSKQILTVYYIAGNIYARMKEDALQVKTKKRTLVENLDPYGYEIEVVKSIASKYNLVFFNVEFIEGFIVDVNTIANFFYKEHIEPMKAMKDYLMSLYVKL